MALTLTEDLSATKWRIGCIVALKSHPFLEKNDCDEIFIGGEPQSLSPLMIVVETLKESRSFYDENSGIQIAEKGRYQCRCIWFSQKTYQIEDAWLSSKLLKLVESNNDAQIEDLNKSIKAYGTLVNLKTASLELGKKKVSLKGSNYEHSKSLAAHLPFVPPVMQVIGTAKSESKEPLIDIKTGERKREISSVLIKCKYFNYQSDKLSEILIPIEALEVVQPVEESKLKLIKQAIGDGSFLKSRSLKRGYKTTLIKPNNINFISGNYYLDAFDFLLGKQQDILISKSLEFTIVDYLSQQLPSFTTEGENIFLTRINPRTIDELDKSKFWRITYVNKKGDLTKRAISDVLVVKIKETDEEGEVKGHYYLKAHCHLRNANRYFLISRIQKIDVLNLSLP